MFFLKEKTKFMKEIPFVWMISNTFFSSLWVFLEVHEFFLLFELDNLSTDTDNQDGP